MSEGKPCVSCYFARMRRDICGIYCVGNYWLKADGSCDHWEHYKRKRYKKTEPPEEGKE